MDRKDKANFLHLFHFLSQGIQIRFVCGVLFGMYMARFRQNRMPFMQI